MIVRNSKLILLMVFALLLSYFTPNIVDASTVLKNGVRHSNVKELKSNLKRLGFTVPGKGTTLYGKDTEMKVKEFQSYYGLFSDGIAGPTTFNKINSILSSPLQNGKRHNDTKTLKANLTILGFIVPGNGTTLFGKDTEQKVKDFQKAHGLIVNGIADEVTLKKISSLLSGVLRNGTRDNKVIKLKEDLAALGYPIPGNGTNYFGKDTEQKVKEFQQKNGLSVTGVADQATLSKIANLISNLPPATPPLLKNGVRHADVKKLKDDLKKLGFTIPGNGTTLYGSDTEKKVKEFQSYYGLASDGVAGNATLTKIASILKTPLQNGKRHNDTIKLKSDLGKLGFPVPGNGTTLYGNDTEKKVREFQKKFNLTVNGIADERTLVKITEELKKLTAPKPDPKPDPEPDTPKEVINYTKYYITLATALDVQMKQLQQTDKYRNLPAYVSAEYIDITESGVISSTGTVHLRTSPELTNDENVQYGVQNGTKITIIEKVEGDSFRDNTVWYKIGYQKETLYVHSLLVNPTALVGKATAKLNVRAEPNTKSHIYEILSVGKEVNITKKGTDWHEISLTDWRNPTREDVKMYLDPSNNNKFQHLVLSSHAGFSASQLNEELKGKGILEGLGQAFIEASKTHSINEIYLISHAFLETGNGTSILSNGSIQVGEIAKNKWLSIQRSGNYIVQYNESNKTWSIKSDTNNEGATAKNIKPIYNMFGIGAVDSNPATLGSIRAFQEGWFTPKDAVIGGTKFIKERYVYNQYNQNTLYKMRWNPANPGYPQYATDVAWAVKQTARFERMYKLLENPQLKFDIVQYQ